MMTSYRWSPELDELMAEWRHQSDQYDRDYEAAQAAGQKWWRERDDTLRITIRDRFAELQG